jgi:hypothetical protein
MGRVGVIYPRQRARPPDVASRDRSTLGVTRVGITSADAFKSQAQRRKFAELLVKGEISPETFEDWNRDR